MRILLISDDKLWTVAAIEDEDGESVWTWLLQQTDTKEKTQQARSMRALLREHVPRNGPPNSRSQGTVLKGTGGIGELKRNPKHGPKLRVLYFFDGEKRIVCTHGFWKKTQTAPRDIEQAQDMKAEYLEADKRGIRVRKLPPHRKRGGPRAAD